MSNDELAGKVTDELIRDPRIDHAAIAVAADDGTITLGGTVGSLREKREAKKAAERVSGVVAVDNELEVSLVDVAKRDDADLSHDVSHALALDSLIPSSIEAKVENGVVTLVGTAVWHWERDEADFVAGNVLGVIGVDDEIAVENSE